MRIQGYQFKARQAIRKHPVGMKPKIGKGSASPPQSAPDKATSLRLLRGAPFGLKAEVLNQQGRLMNFLRYRTFTNNAEVKK